MNQLIEDLLTFSEATRNSHTSEIVYLNLILYRFICSQNKNNKNNLSSIYHQKKHNKKKEAKNNKYKLKK